eukprot:TRINITY_DN7490_c0_g1_i3.p1 TRINITY_DN7490_c0_g1~~TRINITY_DN7490_c0_g1_i3.p1  ORF type:complete len:1058 (-),score=41.10 TRINITY_DN7490_c0_g1_i3:3074-6247(-)
MNSSILGMIPASQAKSQEDNVDFLEVLKECSKNPVLAQTLQQLVDNNGKSMSSQGKEGMHSLIGASDFTTASSFQTQPSVQQSVTLNYGIGLDRENKNSSFANIESLEQQFLRKKLQGQDEYLVKHEFERRSMSQLPLLYAGTDQLTPHDLLNVPTPAISGVHEVLTRYLSRQEHSIYPHLPLGSGMISSPASSRMVQKQVSMPERDMNLNISELVVSQTPFVSLANKGYQMQESSTALSCQSSFRRRANSDPVLSGDLDQLKPENLKYMLQKLPPVYSAVTVIAPFLPQITVKVCCQLIKSLGKCNLHSRAWQIFGLIREIPAGHLGVHLRSVDIYNSMIQLCLNSTYNALQVYAALIEDGLIPNTSVYASLLSICSKCDDLERTEELYKKAYQENCVDKEIFGVMLEMYSKMEQWAKVRIILQDIKNANVDPDIQLHNIVINHACKKRQLQIAMEIFQRIFQDGLLPSHKTLLVIRPVVQTQFCKNQVIGVRQEENEDANTQLIQGYVELFAQYVPQEYRANLYQTLMTSFDKQGEVAYATTLYDCLCNSKQVGKLSVEFCNIAISACAHQGYYVKAQNIFDEMKTNCEVEPQAVTYANLLRAYKKGGQWCSAVLVFERMKEAGYSPHGAVYGSCLDLCWKAGVSWALAKASQILVEGLTLGLLDEPQEVIQRNTLRLDLRALTCGAAVLSMKQWLLSLRERLIGTQDPNLLGVKRLVIVNGVGEGTKGQTSCAVVKNVVASSLAGYRSPFTLTQDSRLLKLEAQMPALKQWVFSEAFESFIQQFNCPSDKLMTTVQYVDVENNIQKECGQLWNHLCRQQVTARPNLQTMNPDYIQLRFSLIAQLQELQQRCNWSELSLFSSIILMDILTSVPNQVQLGQWEMVRLPILCAYFVQSADEVGRNTQQFAGLAQCNSEQFNALVYKYQRFIPQPIQFLVSPIHYLRLFVERLGHSMQDPCIQSQMSKCNLLVLDVISNPASIQFPASLVAPAALKVFRKLSGVSPEWPSVLSQLTSYSEDSPSLVECEKMVILSRGRMNSINSDLNSSPQLSLQHTA